MCKCRDIRTYIGKGGKNLGSMHPDQAFFYLKDNKVGKRFGEIKQRKIILSPFWESL